MPTHIQVFVSQLIFFGLSSIVTTYCLVTLCKHTVFWLVFLSLGMLLYSVDLAFALFHFIATNFADGKLIGSVDWETVRFCNACVRLMAFPMTGLGFVFCCVAYALKKRALTRG